MPKAVIPPPPPIGEDAAKLFEPLHRAMGRALACWQHVETCLFAVAHVLMGTDFETSRIIYFHIKSVEIKLALVMKLTRNQVKQNEYQRWWKQFFDVLSHDVELRNAIAHFDPTLILNPATNRYEAAIATHHLDPKENQVMLDLASVIALEGQFNDQSARLTYLGWRYLPHWQQQVALLPPRFQQTLDRLRSRVTPESPPPPLRS